MSTTDDMTPLDDSDAREILEDRFGDRRHVLEHIADLDGPLSDDAKRILDVLDRKEGGQS